MLESVNYLVPKILKDKSDYDLRGTKNWTVSCNFNLIAWWFFYASKFGTLFDIAKLLGFHLTKVIGQYFFLEVLPSKYLTVQSQE